MSLLSGGRQTDRNDICKIVGYAKEILKDNLFNISVFIDFTATKEVSYLQAIAAAGTMYEATESCNEKDNNLCGCGAGGKFTNSAGRTSVIVLYNYITYISSSK